MKILEGVESGRAIALARLHPTRNVFVTAAADSDYTALWEWDHAGAITRRAEWGGAGGPADRVRDLAFTADGEEMLIAAAGRAIEVRRIADGRGTGTFGLGPHGSQEWCSVLPIASDTRIVAGNRARERTEVYDADQGDLVVSFWGSSEGGVLVLAPGGHLIATTLRSISGDSIRFVGTNGELRFYAREIATDVAGGACRFSPDGRAIAIAGGFPPLELAVHDFPGGERRFIWYGFEDDEVEEPWELADGMPWLTSFAFTPDGSSVLCPTPRGTIQQVDARTGDLRDFWPAHDGLVVSVDLRADGMLLSAGRDGGVRLWTTEFAAGTGAVDAARRLDGTRTVSAFPDWQEMDTVESDE